MEKGQLVIEIEYQYDEKQNLVYLNTRFCNINQEYNKNPCFI